MQQRLTIRHVLCTLLLAGVAPGCLYLPKIVRKTDNQPPTLLEPTEQQVAQGPILVELVAARPQIRIRAVDPDDDELFVFWTGDRGFNPEEVFETIDPPEPQNGVWTFVIFPPRNPKYHEMTLTAHVVDPSFEEKIVDFFLVVP